MTPHKARKLCFILFAATMLLAMLGAAWKWNEGVVALLGLVGIGAACFVLVVFWRCPHCDKSLGKLGNLKYCPYCGEKLDGE